MKTMHVIVEGRVQGVFFRDYTKKQASLLHLGGWVRNLHDGSVEAVLQGTEEDVSAMLVWLKNGSPSARVDGIRTSEVTDDQQYSTFQVRG